MSAVVEGAFSVIAGVALETGDRFRPLHEPEFKGNEAKYVQDCVESGWVSSVGAYVDRFEKDLAAAIGAKNVVAVVNGTAALHLCLVALGVQAGDEVLMPALTFVATANAVAYTGATPHFCDVEDKYLGLCAEKLDEYLSRIASAREDGACVNKQTGRRIAAVIPMHVFGHPVDMKALCRVAAKYNIPVIEDAAESLGSTYDGKGMGNFGVMGAISFNGNKVITTGGGGAIATNDNDLAGLLKHLSTTAKNAREGFFYHDRVGYNYRLPNINAALGCGQLEQLDDYLAKKRKLAEAYRARLQSVEGISFIDEPPLARSNYWLCSAKLDNPADLMPLVDKTNKAGLMTRPLWNLMNTLPMYAQCPSMDLSVSEDMVTRVISMPSSPNLLKHAG